MLPDGAPGLTRPYDLRPAQSGLVLFRWVSLRHIAATLVDLAEREIIGVEEAPGDWLISGPVITGRHGGLARYETKLLSGLFASGDRILVSEIPSSFGSTLKSVRSRLIADAVRHGRLRRRHRDRRTEEGERMLRQIQAFRRKLGRADDETLSNHLPDAVLFGLQVRPEDPPKLMRFAADWTARCADLVDWKKPPPDPRDDDWGVSMGENHFGGLPPGGGWV